MGERVFVSGTAPVADDGSTFAPGDAYAQAARCIDLVRAGLEGVGADLAHVVRTRLYVTDVGCWSEVARAHREAFGDHPPATTLVEVGALIDPAMLVEIEADAIVPPPA